MSSVTIERIRWVDPLPAPLDEIHLERPVEGGEWVGSTIEVSGRVVGRSAPLAAVEISHRGRALRRLPLCAGDAAGTPGREESGATRFSGLVSTLGLPELLELDVSVVLGGGPRVAVGRLEGCREPLRPNAEASLEPLMVTTLGRRSASGLMSLLAAHPRVVALRRSPYECRTAKYWLQVLATLAEPTMQSTGIGGAHGDRGRAGAYPLLVPDLAREPRPGVGLYTDRVAELCLRNIDSWYGELAHDLIKSDVRYFAETFPPSSLPALVRELYPRAKEVFLVRDFRDWISSLVAGKETPGSVGDGEERIGDGLRRQAAGVRNLSEQWRQRGVDAHLVRYEDLVLDAQGTISSLLEYLELDDRRESVETLLEAARVDWSPSGPGGAALSVGRWRRELGPLERELVEEALGEALRTFGYSGREPDREPARAAEV